MAGLGRGFLLATLLVGNALHAAEPAGTRQERVSVKTFDIGRVFMTPAERDYLDRLRIARPVADDSADSGAENPASQTSAVTKAPAAGYIVSSRGTPYQWRDGDFRAASVTQIKRLQQNDDVKVIRHRHSPDPVERDAAAGHGTDARQGGDGDTGGDRDGN